MAVWQPVSFDTLNGWHRDDHLAALSCFRMSARGFQKHAHISRPGISPSESLMMIAEKSLQLDMKRLSGEEARRFFEADFQPMSADNGQGFVTAYFEPEVPASRTRSPEYTYPLYRRPEDLVKLRDTDYPTGLDADLEYARQTDEGLVEYPDRKAIDSGALEGMGLELFWLRSRVEGYYIHIQGSARLMLTDGTTTRVSYAGKTGHPYTSIGKLLVKHGVMTVDEANMGNIRKWLEEDDDRAMELLHNNRSFIFFAEVTGHEPEFGPIAAAGVQLTPGRSLAVDKLLHAYGTPIWLETHKPLPSQTEVFRRLMIAQDTGSAIVGPKRGDIFIGSGNEAGLVAGSVRHDTAFVVFQPKAS